MNAPLHDGHRHVRHLADDHSPGMPDRSRSREMRNFCVVDARRTRNFVGECAQSAAKHDAYARTQFRFPQNKFRRGLGAHELLAGFCFGLSACAHFKKIPTIEADIRVAMVPASIARMPNFASCDFRFGASEPMPPICIPIELKFANPHNANVAIVNERGSSVPFIGPSMENATSSLTTIRVPRRFPICTQSCHGTPMTNATGAKAQPKTCCRLVGNHITPCAPRKLWIPPKIPLVSAISARKAISIAPTL